MKLYIPLALAAALTSGLLANAQTTQFGLLVQHAGTRTTDGHNTVTDTQVDPTPSGQVSEMHWANAYYLRFQSSTIYGDSTHNTTFNGNPVYSLFGSGELNNDAVFTIVNRPPSDSTCVSNCTNPAYYPDGSTKVRGDGSYSLNTMSDYKTHLKQILNYHYLNNAPNRLPGIVQIENEPTATRFYGGKYNSGENEQTRMSDYVDQLTQAISVIKNVNNGFTGVKVTDGGTTSDPLCIMTWDNLYDGGNGITAANSFGNKVLHHGETSNAGVVQTDIVSWLPNMSYDFHHPNNPIGPPNGADPVQYANMLQAWKNSVQLMTAYNNLSGLDYVNIHFYKKVDTTTPSQFAAAFGTVIGYLRDNVVPNKTIISTEMGQYDQDSAVVTAMINKINNINSQADHQLPVVIWYDADGYDKTNSKTVAPYGLHWGNDDSGVSDPKGIGCLNDSGSAFYQGLTGGNLPSHCVINRNQ